MLRIELEETETYNETTEKFGMLPHVVVDLEHSLISLSKWESKYQKPFLIPGDKTNDEVYDYIRAMIVTPDVDPDVVLRFSPDQLMNIQKYIDSPQSATTFGEMPKRTGPGETITAELIYYWMVAFTIPFEVETWHLNRLFALVRICNIKNAPKKKMSRSEIAQRNAALNEQRRREWGTSG